MNRTAARLMIYLLPVANVPPVQGWRALARGSISWARGIQCCPNMFYSFCPTSFSILWRIYIYSIYIYICVCVCARVCVCTHTHTHAPDCVEIVYEIPLLSNNTASETFLHESGAVQSVDWIFIIRAPAWRWLDDYVTLGKTFYKRLLEQEVAAAAVTSTCSSLSHFSRRPLL